MDVDRHNLAEIERLNQRGGRTLSIIDLIDAGTISTEMAALCWLIVSEGAGFLTGAVPGGAGKTTLMAALLSFLPPGERIQGVADRRVIDDALSGATRPPATILAHEIGSGHWYGYIWGRDAVDFFGLWRLGLRPVSCLHADDPEQTRRTLVGLGVSEEDLRHVPLQLFMRVGGGRARARRRVDSLHCVLDGRLRPVYRWRESGDIFARLLDREDVCEALAAQHGRSQGEFLSKWDSHQAFLEGLLGEGVRSFEAVRRRVARHCGA